MDCYCWAVLLAGVAACSSSSKNARLDEDATTKTSLVAQSINNEPVVSTTPSQLARVSASSKLVFPPAKIAQQIVLRRIHKGLSKPLGLEFYHGDPQKRLFVVEQPGTIRAIVDGEVSKVPLLDLRKLVSRGHSEQGLLGLAFHPQFKDNHRFYVNYTDREGATRVVEYVASEKAGVLQAGEPGKQLLKIAQPWGNHNGGGIEFAPDGTLYVGMGDGGKAGDPKGAGQDPNTKLGKMLRIDVESGAVQVVQSGLRNPWRFTFDRETGALYIADVGQNQWEEIDVIANKDIVGANWGWSVMEGRHCYPESGCDSQGMRAPAIEYDHNVGCSVTGGVVYRGKDVPSLRGAYFYSDFCTAIVRSFRWKAGQVSDHWDWKAVLDPKFRLAQVSSFAEDEDGEIYLISSSGSIYKLSVKRS